MKCSKSILLLAISAAIFESVSGRTRTEAEMAASAISIVNQAKPGMTQQAPLQKATLIERRNAVALYQVGERFAFVSTDDLLPEVLGYTDQALNPENLNPNLASWLNAVEHVGQEIIAKGGNAGPARAIAPGEQYAEYIDAMCSTHWDQDEPYNNLCPIGTESGYNWQGYESEGRCVTGCVATAMAQVLNYHQAPVIGIGTHSVQVKQKNGSYQTYTADYEQENYDWDHMIDDYATVNYTEEEAHAVALLMYHCGVAADMVYATDGSGTYMNNCRDGLERNFGFQSAVLLARDSYSEAQWMEYVYNELNNDRPIIYAGDDMNYRAGHCFVLDGYDTRGYVHINWGWGQNHGDGFFEIGLLNVSPYQFKWYQEMVIGVEGSGSRRGYYTVDLEEMEAGSLEAQIAETQVPLDSLKTLNVSGSLNNDDFAYIRNLSTNYMLQIVDIHNTDLTTLPDSAFSNCANLRKVMLPRTITEIGKYAFGNSSKLSEVRVYFREKPASTSASFKDFDASHASLFVPAGTSDVFKRTLRWKDFGSINEFGTAVIARSFSRKVGQSNPKFTYTVEGKVIYGTPEFECEATKNSPSGRYPIHILPGTIAAEDVDFVDGVLIVMNADGTVTGIEEVETNTPSCTTYYNLRGQQISAEEAARAASYISNGRIYVR